MRIQIRTMATGLLAMLLASCQAEPKMLGITGYNYTDRYIDGFSVNGQGGGNVFLSEDRAGGGKTACCIAFRPDRSLPVKVHVEWRYGYENDFDTGQLLKPAENYQAEVELKGPLPEEPTLFVVHFYPDNTVQVEVTADYPKPRIRRNPPHTN